MNDLYEMKFSKDLILLPIKFSALQIVNRITYKKDTTKRAK